ncbi:hypothetical protein BH23CHL5_BH23CHL5_17920 [soil metagenome]
MGHQLERASGFADPATIQGLNGQGGQETQDNGWKSLPAEPELQLTPNRTSCFAHPTEEKLARIFTFYCIRWHYEPTSFHLELDVSGRPIEQVTPDFYLPDHDLYIELTTMRQSLVTRKNRKIRRLKEAFPSLNVKLLYRKDYDRIVGSLLSSPGGDELPSAGKPIFTEQRIRRRLSDMVNEIFTDSRTSSRLDFSENGNAGPNNPANGTVHLLGLGSGSCRIVQTIDDACRLAGHAATCDWLSLTRYGANPDQERVRINRRPRLGVTGIDIVLIADIISTGLSVAFVANWLELQGARSVRICTLLDRRDARILDLPIHASGFEAPNELLVGYGISYQQQFDDLPDIAALRIPGKSRVRERVVASL